MTHALNKTHATPVTLATPVIPVTHVTHAHHHPRPATLATLAPTLVKVKIMAVAVIHALAAGRSSRSLQAIHLQGFALVKLRQVRNQNLTTHTGYLFRQHKCNSYFKREQLLEGGFVVVGQFDNIKARSKEEIVTPCAKLREVYK